MKRNAYKKPCPPNMPHCPGILAIHMDSKLHSLFAEGDAEKTVNRYIHHESGFFGTAFNANSANLNEKCVEKLFVNTRKLLIAGVETERYESPVHLAKSSVLILKNIGFHFRYLDWLRYHSETKAPEPKDTPEKAAPRPIILYGLDYAFVADTHSDPVSAAIGLDLQRMICNEARKMGRLLFQVARAYRLFELDRGKSNGAYLHIARRALLSPEGQVVKIIPHRVEATSTAKPCKKTYNQVRKLHALAKLRMQAVAARLGFVVPI